MLLLTGARAFACMARASGACAALARAAPASGLCDLLRGDSLPTGLSWRCSGTGWPGSAPPTNPFSSSSGPQPHPPHGQPDISGSAAPTPDPPANATGTANPDPATAAGPSDSADLASAPDFEAPQPPPSPTPSGPASRRDKGAAADTIYASSQDDNLGVQRNWFNALYSQLNVVNRTGMVPHMKGRQKEVFEAVEREFEALWERHVRGKGLQGTAHRGMLLCCLAIATHKVLRYESGDDELVREVVRTNLGGVAVGVMMRLHKARLWLLLRLLADDPYKQAVRLLPSLQSDMGSLLDGQVEAGEHEATWTIRRCGFHSVLAAEDSLELMPEFCCQYSMQWLEGFSDYGVRVGLVDSLGFGDECCRVRINRRQTVDPPQPPQDEKPASTAGGQQ